MTEAGYKLEVRVNGNPVAGLVLKRTLDKTAIDSVTLSGHAVVRLKKDDIISVYLIPTSTGVDYKIEANEARLNLKMERRF